MMWKRHHIRAHYVSPWVLPAARLKAGCDEQVRKKTIDSRSLSQPSQNSQLITYHFFIWINFSWNIVCSLFFENLLGWPWGPALCFLWPAHHHINLLMLALSGKIGFILMINDHWSFNDHYKWKSFCLLSLYHKKESVNVRRGICCWETRFRCCEKRYRCCEKKGIDVSPEV